MNTRMVAVMGSVITLVAVAFFWTLPDTPLAPSRSHELLSSLKTTSASSNDAIHLPKIPSEYDQRMIELENRLVADPSISERERLRQVWNRHVELRLGASLSEEKKRQVRLIHEEELNARDRLDLELANGTLTESRYPERLAEVVRAANQRYASVLSRNEFMVLMDAAPEDDPSPLLQ